MLQRGMRHREKLIKIGAKVVSHAVAARLDPIASQPLWQGCRLV